MEDKKFAILIDADNISEKYVSVIIEEATKEGIITYKRIYGDWTKPNLNSWKSVLLEYSINPMQQYAYTSGKNSTDSAMIIDAMDILYTGNVDGFCLVSSDSDFTKLAARLKESGKVVIGMGLEHTPKAFVAACSKFKYIDIISKPAVKEKPVKKDKKETTNKKEQQVKTAKKAKKEELTLTKEDVIKKSIDSIIEENSDADGWVLASTIGTSLQKLYPDFDCRNYGCKKMIDLLKKFEYKTKVLEDKTTYFVTK